jgi:hypothetical protein
MFLIFGLFDLLIKSSPKCKASLWLIGRKREVFGESRNKIGEWSSPYELPGMKNTSYIFISFEKTIPYVT